MAGRRVGGPKKSSKGDWRITRGGRKLAKLIDVTGITAAEFARGAGVDRMTLHRILSGERWKRLDINAVFAICAHAKGSVVVIAPEDFLEITATPLDAEDANDDSVPPAKRRTGTEG